jgi:chemotaxis protein methyltransferase CheR
MGKMKKKDNSAVDAAPLPSSPLSQSSEAGRVLRRQAEEIVRKKGKLSTENLSALSIDEIRQTLHELQVHQIELEMQNEELRASQEELDAARARYFDLYDLAPVGYLTVSEKARILEANLTAASLLGLTRDTLVKQPISRFILKEDQDIYYLYRKKLFETGELQTCELRIMKKDGTAFWASLSATVEQAADGAPVYRIVISDITVRKLAEAYREMGREVLQILNEPGNLQDSIRRSLSALKARTGLDAAGIRLQDGDDFPYFVQEGFADDFLLTENTLIERSADGGVCRDKDGKLSLQCTCGLVISGRTDPSNPRFTAGGSCWASDSFPLLDIPPGEDLRLHPRNRCILQGYASVALVPIRVMDRIVGLLQLNDRRKGCFTLEVVELLEGIASHIGAALMRKRTEDMLQIAHEELEKQVKWRTAELVAAMKEVKKGKEKAEAALSEIKKLKNQLEAERAYLQEEIKLANNHEKIIGQSHGLKYVLYKAEQIAGSDTTVLVLGETGTGKELVARAIHGLSLRKDRALVKVNCAALPSNLIESELFGYEKGAFTGAQSRHLGRFEVANGATLFLDEIGELPLELQPKLLRVLQDGEFERLGSSRTIKVDVRIIAATNRNLEAEVRRGRFRQDLWYRLNVFPITTPPLRDRMEDIPLLVDYYVKKISKRMGKIIEMIPAGVMDALQNYHWPGNVRELENVLERAVINSSGSGLCLADELKKPFKGLNISQKTLAAVERDHIVRTLEQAHWKVGGKYGAAEILGLDRSTLRARMRKLDIRKP